MQGLLKGRHTQGVLLPQARDGGGGGGGITISSLRTVSVSS